jgi:hypothetical protein
MLSQCLLGLRQLNALPTGLDLKILSSQILQLPIPPPAHKIAGSEQPASRSAKEIGYKALRCQGRLVPIPMPSDRLAFHIEFPGHTYRHQPLLLIEHMQPQVVDRPSSSAQILPLLPAGQARCS